MWISYKIYTDTKKHFLIYKEIQVDRVPSHIWLTASSYMVKYLRISLYIRNPFLIYNFAPDPILISLYKIWGNFCFLSYQCTYFWGSHEKNTQLNSVLTLSEMVMMAQLGKVIRYTLIKKKIKFSSYIRKFRWIECKVIYDWRPPHIWWKIANFLIY